MRKIEELTRSFGELGLIQSNGRIYSSQSFGVGSAIYLNRRGAVGVRGSLCGGLVMSAVLRREEIAEALREVFTCRVGRPRTMRHLCRLEGRGTVPRDWGAERRGQLGRGHAEYDPTRRSHSVSELLLSYGVMPCPCTRPQLRKPAR